MMEAACPISLDPPLRRFRPEDAAVVARLNDMASMGMVLTVWSRINPDDPWAHGTKRQVERMESGQIIVVADTGGGAEAVLMANPVQTEPGDPSEVAPEFQALVELENLVLGSWYVNVLATLPEARGKGHGRTLMKAAEDMARAEGHDVISLIASDANDLALPLYRALGFTERARRPIVKGDWDGPGNEWILMAKDVSPAS